MLVKPYIDAYFEADGRYFKGANEITPAEWYANQDPKDWYV